MTTKRRSGLITIVAIAAVISLAAVSFFVYTGVYYHADEEAVSTYLAQHEAIMVEKSQGRYVAHPAGECLGGVVFYPGGKVEGRAYLPLMVAFASRGYTAVLVEMPLRLAIMAPNAADGITQSYPEIAKWYMAGHSLGGVMAARYASKHADRFEGLLLLGAYPDKDVPSDLGVLSLYGSEDKVLNRAKYAKGRWPDDTTEYVIQGGCHAFFGTYGAQKGDGDSTVSNVEQIELTADYFATWAESRQ